MNAGGKRGAFTGYADLARRFRRGRDFDISVRRRPGSRVAVIAPHGGRIENGTSEIARAVAGDDFHLYLFEGALTAGNFHRLHLTSHLFDEPECLELIADSPYVLAVHGCDGVGRRAYLGGRDTALRDRLAQALREASIDARSEGHPFPAVHARNICNRGARAKGVQLELTHELRDGPGVNEIVEPLRAELLHVGAA
jgi:phage replication-related protein YjqB (UPF0714/DUF867 family)